MKRAKPVHEIKFSKTQPLTTVVLLLALYEPVVKMIRQGIAFHEYYWLLVAFALVAYVFWYFIRVTIFMIAGIPAVILTKDAITITAKGYTISWKDIDELNLVTGDGEWTPAAVVIGVKDPWKYIRRVRNPVIRNYRWFAKDYFYKPFTITLLLVEGNNYDIFEKIENCYRLYR